MSTACFFLYMYKNCLKNCQGFDVGKCLGQGWCCRVWADTAIPGSSICFRCSSTIQGKDFALILGQEDQRGEFNQKILVYSSAPDFLNKACILYYAFSCFSTLVFVSLVHALLWLILHPNRLPTSVSPSASISDSHSLATSIAKFGISDTVI